MILEEPVATAVARPAAEMVATEVVAEAQVTRLVRFRVDLSVRVPMAVNCWLLPLATEGLAGVTAMETNAAAVTVSTVEPVTPPSLALIAAVPVPAAVARPCEPAALETAATEVVADAQVTWLVRFCVELSVKVPVAENCCVRPFATLGLAGVTAID